MFNRRLMLIDEFDHTFGCYITDYILSLVYAGMAIIILLIKQNTDRGQVIKFYNILVGMFVYFYSFIGGYVHQAYHDNSRAVEFNNIWNLGTTCGLIGILSLFFMGIFIRVQFTLKWLIFSTVVILSSAIIPWVYVDSHIVFELLSFVSIIVVISACKLQIRSTKSVQQKKRLQNGFKLQLLGLILLVLGAVIQLTGTGKQNDAFNHNAIYHVMSASSYPLIALPIVLRFARAEEESDEKKSD
ncbi:Hypothetical_protein [Hexamita inflata]|uniref:Hypothetical_protein n=1 Tax=Hexamita inflata TaxID=28002 RepID=A0AA86QA26_9EUKA|nr:Hypothetical protein HINF_LOCUS39897 [Hexamita inflata]